MSKNHKQFKQPEIENLEYIVFDTDTGMEIDRLNRISDTLTLIKLKNEMADYDHFDYRIERY